MVEIDEQVLEDLYSWIDVIPLSRPKKDLKRDFSDGVLVAEVVKHFHPHLVELHNYASAHAVSKKSVNWHILNRKVFKKLGFEVSDDVIHNVTTCKPWAAEQFLLMLREKVELFVSPPAQSLPLSSPSSATGERFEHGHFSSHFSGGSGRISNSDGSTVMVQQRFVGDDMLVPKTLLDEKLQELLAKDETIQILQAKIQRLEHLVQLKDIRIEDLQTRLKQTQESAAAEADISPGGRPRIIRR